MEKIKIGISIGDINGIGLEVILKTLSNPRIAEICTPVVYGSSKVISYHKNIVGEEFEFHSTRGADKIYDDRINIVNCWQENVNITLGKPSDQGGQYAYLSLEAATMDLKEGLIDALVTAPISKEAMKGANFPYPGHTEYLEEKLGGSESLMFMISDQLRLGLATNHLPLRMVADKLTKELIMRKLQIMNEALKVDFGLERPSIAVLGLNPHAGDGGVIGDEEEKIIRPAVVELKKKGMLVMGPFPADGFFGSGQFSKFDAILAMYHDQGLVPFKALSFGSGVNFTAGLSGIRTSPDHGTAFDIAGKNEADPSSFRKALFLAMDIVRNRRGYVEMHENTIIKREKPFEVEGEDEILKEEEN
ncbi:MAG: 4-hydroxythreonine-4-phosphate dehydrogenase PdxA [Phaeodactylibacter sp.]|nr:4-hydroxythreonine-4-phosphate dehydrogenase PdxA [Phaeodactylibacter sp.]MCB9272868.1 4-hydroxythreonine-4-phosphate dehydrogenase PdxA [Lewinellaceae bacterium]